MDVLSAVIDTRGANIPYIELMENLQRGGTQSHIYVTDDLRQYITSHNVNALIDRFNLGEFSQGHAVYKSANNPAKFLLAARQVLSAWMPRTMVTVTRAIDQGVIVPQNTMIVSNSTGLLYLGHFFLELGFAGFFCLEPYRMVDWMNRWQTENSQLLPPYMPKNVGNQAFRLLFAAHGKRMASQFLQRPIKHGYGDIRRAVVNQLHMYSPQLTQDKTTAAGYPYPFDSGALPKELENFIHRQRQSGKRILVFTIGSMDIDAEDKARLVKDFVEGVRRMQNTAGIILGHDSAQGEDFITMNQFVPYATLFPMVDVIVTHGGAGTTHLALYTGKPVLSVPILKDQFDWAERLERLGMLIGVVPKEQFSTERFVSSFTAGYHADVIQAAQQAAKIELTYNSNNQIASIVDELRLASEALGQQVSGQLVLADLP